MDARVPYEGCPLCAHGGMQEVCTASTTGYPLFKPGLPESQRWMRCADCGHVFTDGYLTPAALELLFSDSHAGQTPGEDIETARYVWAKTVEQVAARRPGIGGRWLDVGFGNGALMATAAELGWDVVGIDLREKNVQAMRELGFEAHACELTRYRSAQPFDVISMADVLEHMPYPKAALAYARGLLQDGGLLYLSLPNSDSLLWETLTRNGVNPYFAEMEHYHNFGRRRLFALLRETGYEPRHVGVSIRYRACIEVIAERVAHPGAATTTPETPALATAETPALATPAGAPPHPAATPPLATPAAPPHAAATPMFDVAGGEIRLNLGCGRFPLEGYVNIDSVPGPGIDLVVDLESATLPFPDDSVSEIHASHLLEHIRSPLPLLQELYRVAKPGALAVFRVPYGASDDADDDPTHVRRYHWGSWLYFSQPAYWRADYGYRGDWEVEELVLDLDPVFAGSSGAECVRAVQERRNVVREMVARLRAIKPARPPLRGLQQPPPIRFTVDGAG